MGLHLTFDWDRVHGGLLALVLDEVLSRAVLKRHGLHWVTAELTTRLKAPAKIGELLSIKAQIVSVRPRLILCTGEVWAETGNRLVVLAAAKMMRP